LNEEIIDRLQHPYVQFEFLYFLYLSLLTISTCMGINLLDLDMSKMRQTRLIRRLGWPSISISKYQELLNESDKSNQIFRSVQVYKTYGMSKDYIGRWLRTVIASTVNYGDTDVESAVMEILAKPEDYQSVERDDVYRTFPVVNASRDMMEVLISEMTLNERFRKTFFKFSAMSYIPFWYNSCLMKFAFDPWMYDSVINELSLLCDFY